MDALPAELCQLILGNLHDLRDLQALAFASRGWAAATRPFRLAVADVVPWEPHWQHFLRLVEHPVYRCHVRTLRVHLPRFPAHRRDGHHAAGCPLSSILRSPWAVIYPRLQQEGAEYRRCLQRIMKPNVWRRILTNLENLERLEIDAGEVWSCQCAQTDGTSRSTAARSRARTRRSALEKKLSTGCAPAWRMLERVQKASGDLIENAEVILTAASTNTKIHDVHVGTIHWGDFPRVFDHTLHAWEPWVERTSRLHLSIGFQLDTEEESTEQRQEEDRELASFVQYNGLFALMRRTTSALRDLSVAYDMAGWPENRLALSAPGVVPLPGHTLERLALSGFRLSLTRLMHFLYRSRDTLQTLELKEIDFHWREDWEMYDEDNEDDEHSLTQSLPPPWKLQSTSSLRNFFCFLARYLQLRCAVFSARMAMMHQPFIPTDPDIEECYHLDRCCAALGRQHSIGYHLARAVESKSMKRGRRDVESRISFIFDTVPAEPRTQ